MPQRLFFCVLVIWGGFGAGCSSRPAPDTGVLRVAINREPTTFNSLLAADVTTQIVTDQLHAPLIRLNQETQEMEPALAESWEFSEDGKTLVFRLKRGVRFSDGEPLTAADVVFTFRVLNDPEVASPLVDTAQIDGEPIVAELIDDVTVAFRLARRTATVDRIFDSIRILPEHRLAESLQNGTLARDSGLGVSVDTIVGLGPFRLRDYEVGQRIVLERNPYYWRSGKEEVYPRLRGLVFDVVPDRSTRALRLSAGEIDLLERISPESFRALTIESPPSLKLEDLGPGMVSERLWFNLNPDSPIESYKKRWFADVRFRRAFSLAIDRRGLARMVYFGLASAASGSVSPANRFWRNTSIAMTERDLDEARRLLTVAGFRLRDDRRLLDRDGNRVKLTIVTTTGSNERQRAGAFIQEDLSELGIDVTLAPLEGGDLLARVTGSYDYDAFLLGITQTDPDPSAEMALWPSRAPLHLWHPSQPEPATAWEARIDELMEAQMAALDLEQRKACYFEVQTIVAEQLPILDLVVPHALLGVHRRVQNVRATPFGHPLWNSDELSLDRSESTTWRKPRDIGH